MERTIRCLDHFWDNFHENLRERRQTIHYQGRSLTKREPRLKEVVLIMDKEQPRGTWKLGIIEDIKAGMREKIRKATVRMANNRKSVRPINALIPLEVTGHNNYPNPKEKMKDNIKEEDNKIQTLLLSKNKVRVRQCPKLKGGLPVPTKSELLRNFYQIGKARPEQMACWECREIHFNFLRGEMVQSLLKKTRDLAPNRTYKK